MSLVDPEDPRVADYRDMIHAAQRRNPMGLQPDESVEAWGKRVAAAKGGRIIVDDPHELPTDEARRASFAAFMKPFARD